MSKLKLLIFLPKPALPTVLPVSVNGNAILPIAQDKILRVIHPIYQDILTIPSKYMFRVWPLLIDSTACTLVQTILSFPNDYGRHLTDLPSSTLAPPPAYSQHMENKQRDPFKTSQFVSLLCSKCLLQCLPIIFTIKPTVATKAHIIYAPLTSLTLSSIILPFHHFTQPQHINILYVHINTILLPYYFCLYKQVLSNKFWCWYYWPMDHT